MNSIVIYLILLIVLILMGCTLPFTFLITSIAITLGEGGSIATSTNAVFNSLNSYSLMAVPLFMIGGSLMQKTGIADKLVVLCEVALRKIRGGLGVVIHAAAMLFGMLTGSGSATAATISSILCDKMSDLGWERRYISAMVTASSPLGFMIPPNMNAILFATVISVSVSRLFLCTIIPGIIWALGYIVVHFLTYKNYYHPSEEVVARYQHSDEIKLSDGTVKKTHPMVHALIDAIPALLMALIMLGGIFSGIFSPTEAGAVSALYAILVGLFFYKNLKGEAFVSTFRQTGMNIGMTMIMVPFIKYFTTFVIKSGATQELTRWMLNTLKEPWMIIVAVDILFVACGFFFDANVLTLVLPPIIYPTMQAVGIDAVQFGCMVFIAIGIGVMTPPVASNFYTSARICEIDPMTAVKPIVPLIVFVAIPVLLLVSFVPGLTHWLPDLVMGVASV